MNVIITIPAYNEEKDIAKTINEIKDVMSSVKYNYKIIVYDDGSTDRTADISKKCGAKVFSNKKNIGLAETFKNEMKACIENDADIIVHTDADGQYPATFIPVMIKKVEQGNDLVLGSRFEKGNYSGSFMKRIGNIAFAKLFSNLLKTKITDTTTGFRAFTKDVAKLPIINTFTYTQEQLIRVGKSHMKIAEIPINTRKTRESKLFRSPIHYAIKAWINIIRIYRDYEPLKFFGRIGLGFILTGCLLGIYLFFRILIVGGVGGIKSAEQTDEHGRIQRQGDYQAQSYWLERSGGYQGGQKYFSVRP